MNPIQNINQAMELLSRGQVQQAAQISSQLLEQAPDSALAHFLACEVAIARNLVPQALDHITKSVGLDDQQAELQLRKADVEVMSRQGLQAQETAKQAAARFPDDCSVQLEVARVFTECGNHQGAEAFLRNAGKLEPHNPKYLFDYSTNQFFLGNTEETDKAITDFLDLHLPVRGRKLLLRSRLKKQTPDDNHVDMLKEYLAGQISDVEAVNSSFALAKELEDIGEFGQAFEALESGAAIQRKIVRFSPDEELKNINDLIDTFQPEPFAAIADSDCEDSPVFIVGMPRTGTTLVERIVKQKEGAKSVEESYDFTLAFSSVINEYIAANPGAGLNPLSASLKVDYNDIARNYINSMRGMLGESDCYVDKTPFNFLYCGLIMKAFPRARILHVVRDPMDACYAVFKTLFNKAYYYSYDLAELADYYIAYRRLMDHWRRLMPGAILDVHYEQLVSNPHDVSKQIADFVGIEWSEQLTRVEEFEGASATASAAQVREPIHTGSVGLWHHYAIELEPVRERLSEAGIVDASGNALA